VVIELRVMYPGSRGFVKGGLARKLYQILNPLKQCHYTLYVLNKQTVNYFPNIPMRSYLNLRLTSRPPLNSCRQLVARKRLGQAGSDVTYSTQTN